jgi:hypothetical protein
MRVQVPSLPFTVGALPNRKASELRPKTCLKSRWQVTADSLCVENMMNIAPGPEGIWVGSTFFLGDSYDRTD